MSTGCISDVRLEVADAEPPHSMKLTMTGKILSPVDDNTWDFLASRRKEFAQALADAFVRVFDDFADAATVDDFEI